MSATNDEEIDDNTAKIQDGFDETAHQVGLSGSG
jgi:hypothetical protein